MQAEKTDFFMENPQELRDGAKLVLGRLVSDQIRCMKVPRIFDSLEAAIASGTRFIIRSDHPAEYYSLAGILNSVTAKPEGGAAIVALYTPDKALHALHSNEDLTALLPKILYNQGEFKGYLQLTGTKADDLMKDFHFSFWEYAEGINGAVFADPVVPRKYHFFHVGKHINYFQLNTATGELKAAGSQRELNDLIPNGQKTLFKVAEAYETIRNFSKFNSDHCYEMEYQIDEKGNIYFLQLRRIKDFSPSNFKLERKPEKDEVEGSFVIGKTSEEGIALRTQSPPYYPFAVDTTVEALIMIERPLTTLRYPNLKAVIFHHSSLDYFAVRGVTHQSRDVISAANLVTHW